MSPATSIALLIAWVICNWALLLWTARAFEAVGRREELNQFGALLAASFATLPGFALSLEFVVRCLVPYLRGRQPLAAYDLASMWFGVLMIPGGPVFLIVAGVAYWRTNRSGRLGGVLGGHVVLWLMSSVVALYFGSGI